MFDGLHQDPIKMAEQMSQAVLESDIIPTSADIMKRMVEELQSRGFSREEAITLASNFKALGN